MKRKNPRYRLKTGSNWMCSFNMGTLFGYQIIDLSPWGVRLSLSIVEAPNEGDAVSLAFSKNGEIQFVANGLVKWRSEDENNPLPILVGIEFSSAGSDILPMWIEAGTFDSVDVVYSGTEKSSARQA